MSAGVHVVLKLMSEKEKVYEGVSVFDGLGTLRTFLFSPFSLFGLVIWSAQTLLIEPQTFSQLSVPTS